MNIAQFVQPANGVACRSCCPAPYEPSTTWRCYIGETTANPPRAIIVLECQTEVGPHGRICGELRYLDLDLAAAP